MYKLVKKMNIMKSPLNKLTWKNGNLFQNVKKMEADLKKAQVEIEASPSNKEGNWFECDNVADQFLKHFEKFMGNNGETKQIDNAEDLFINKIPQNEIEFMFRDITDAEIKEEIFGIVKEFFKLNKVLVEVNDTLITLVPKIQQPNKVLDYRPIACCNVIYKCISKIITKRLQGCLDKPVNLNQSVFILGRLIQNNFLITQELLKGFTRKIGPQRCALKIDIAKAYDTMNWGFLKQILVHFGFHEKIIGWIMTYVTSATFSMCVNGDRYGYFKSGRGLRQGDPVSPYLFTLVMEVLTLIIQRRVNRSHQFKYHWGCKEIKLTQLCFATDLLMLCNGDHKYVEVLKEGLMEFSKLVEKVKQKVNDWENRALSYAGRLQLIALVLASIHVY
nr:hypothetical protein [Tanacetum cinerariifolium]